MVIINTTRFGDLEVSEDEIIKFSSGIPGFLDEKEFIIKRLDNGNPLAFLQSLQTPDLAFIIADPFSFYYDYEFDLDETTKSELEITNIDDLAIWAIVTVPKDFKNSTLNLSAPLVINVNKGKAKQIIIDKAQYPIKAPLFPEKVGEK